MKKFQSFFIILATVFSIAVFAANAAAQNRETYTGTVIIYGSGQRIGTTTNTFNLTINRRSTPQEAQRYLGILAEGGQDDLQRAIRNEDLGFFSLGGQVGRRLNFVWETETEGQRRIFAVFERWIGFGELRAGRRSVDYPFGVIEMVVNPRTGRGEGTFIAAARVRFDADRRTGQNQVEIENFGTFPGRLIGVRQRR